QQPLCRTIVPLAATVYNAARPRTLTHRRKNVGAGRTGRVPPVPFSLEGYCDGPGRRRAAAAGPVPRLPPAAGPGPARPPAARQAGPVRRGAAESSGGAPVAGPVPRPDVRRAGSVAAADPGPQPR